MVQRSLGSGTVNDWDGPLKGDLRFFRGLAFKCRTDFLHNVLHSGFHSAVALPSLFILSSSLDSGLMGSQLYSSLLNSAILFPPPFNPLRLGSATRPELADRCRRQPPGQGKNINYQIFFSALTGDHASFEAFAPKRLGLLTLPLSRSQELLFFPRGLAIQRCHSSPHLA